MGYLVCLSHLLIILSSAVFIQGLKRNTQTHHVDVAVKVGEEASLQCPLTYSEDVLQVMWQKMLPEGEVTVATCLQSSHKLNPDFSSKIRLRDTSLKSCSIAVRNVTEQDVGCYHCVFITSSNVAYDGRACLHICELHEPVLNISRSNSGELVVSCSATGRPAPDVTLLVQQTTWTRYYTELNSNGTVTVIRTAALSPLNLSGARQCKCSATLGSEQRRVSKQITDTEFEYTAVEVRSTLTEDHSVALWIGLTVLCVCVCACVIVGVVIRRFVTKSQDDSSDVEYDSKEYDEVVQGCITPAKQRVNEEHETSVHLRSPASCKKSATSPRPSEIQTKLSFY